VLIGLLNCDHLKLVIYIHIDLQVDRKVKLSAAYQYSTLRTIITFIEVNHTKQTETGLMWILSISV
jgi:hypothetical protein